MQVRLLTGEKGCQPEPTGIASIGRRRGGRGRNGIVEPVEDELGIWHPWRDRHRGECQASYSDQRWHRRRRRADGMPEKETVVMVIMATETAVEVVGRMRIGIGIIRR